MMSSLTDTCTAAPQSTLRVEAWLDPLVEKVGHDPRSAYVETYWLPVLGPSTTWFLRYVSLRLDASPEGIELPVEETARSLGIGERLGPSGPFARTVKRSVDFGMAEWRTPSRLAVRLRLPPLARRHLLRLPRSLQARHAAELEAARRAPNLDELRRHGRRLALSLLALGDDRSGAEQQLRRRSVHPALAAECAAWAASEQARNRVAADGWAGVAEPLSEDGPVSSPPPARGRPPSSR